MNFTEMNREEFDNYMCKTYPDIFRDRNKSIKESCMAWGFNIEKGWYELLDNLCRKLKTIQEFAGIEVVANQVKEKYGELCFYYVILGNREIDEVWREGFIDIIDSLIRYAELKSRYVCELCGKSGKLCVRGGWLKALCKNCAKEVRYENFSCFTE